jgi:hypothetical protein
MLPLFINKMIHSRQRSLALARAAGVGIGEYIAGGLRGNKNLGGGADGDAT